MLIGSSQVELYLPGTTTLKEKRFILKSIKTKVQNRFNVSIAEVDYQDKWQRTCLGIACVSNERRFIDSVLSKVVSLIMQDGRVELLDQVNEIF